MIAKLVNVSKSYGGAIPVRALNQATLAIPSGTRMMIAGRSGSGKSTLARILAGWEKPDSGSVEYSDNVTVHLIPQEPGASLNPHFTGLEIVAEPYRIRGLRGRHVTDRATEWTNRVELFSDSRNKLSCQFSGGEQARLAIARALAATTIHQANRGLLLFDESFSALDESLRVRLYELLLRLQQDAPVTYVFLSHDLSITPRFVHRIAVIDNAEMVEEGPCPQLLQNPQSETLKLLIDASRSIA